MKETEAVLDDLDDSDSIRNPFTDSSSGEWYVGFFLIVKIANDIISWKLSILLE